MRVLVLAAVLAAPAAAQELVFSTQATESCVAVAGSYAAWRRCIGASAERCMKETPGGYSTVAMGGCTAMEADYWDARLNTVYQQMMARARQADEENKEYGGFAPSQAEALRAMQRAWIPYRDAKCAFERSLWGGGTGAGPAGVSCVMYTTAEQVLLLQESGLGE